MLGHVLGQLWLVLRQYKSLFNCPRHAPCRFEVQNAPLLNSDCSLSPTFYAVMQIERLRIPSGWEWEFSCLYLISFNINKLQIRPSTYFSIHSNSSAHTLNILISLTYLRLYNFQKTIQGQIPQFCKYPKISTTWLFAYFPFFLVFSLLGFSSSFISLQCLPEPSWKRKNGQV